MGLADVQGGLRRARPEDKTLNHITSTAGQDIYRGDRLPADLRGDLLFGEPVGRLVRRAKVDVKNGLTTLTNPYEANKSEFIRSTDPAFRPVNLVTAPDGTIYITDMYRGIIQEGNWVRQGSYLRKVVEQYSLDKIVGCGRIWRLVHDSAKPGPQPKLLDQTTAGLVPVLAHPNGWWRDTAQKLLILRQDKAVVPALAAMASSHKDPLARLHALWTLEGLEAVSPALVREKLKDKDPALRAAAIRVSESLYKAGDHSLVAELQEMVKDPDPTVASQSVLTAGLLKWPNSEAFITASMASSSLESIKVFGTRLLQKPDPFKGKFNPDQIKVLNQGGDIFKTLCATCHGADAAGLPMAGGAPGAMLAPSLARSKTITGPKEAGIYVLLHGLNGDIDGKKYEGQMVSMASNNDQWIAAVLSYVRNSFGNQAGMVTAAEVAALRSASTARTTPWTIDELRAAIPKDAPPAPGNSGRKK